MVVTRNLLLSIAPAVMALVLAVLVLAVPAAAVAQTPPPAAQPATPPPPAKAPPSSAPPAVEANDPFGEEVELQAETIVYVPGSGQWENAYKTLVDAFVKVKDGLNKLGIKPDGPPMTIYTDPTDTGFSYQAAIAVKTAPTLPADSELKVGKSPEGRALRFVHRGSYGDVEATYEAITDRLDEKHLEARDLIIEKYRKDLAPEQDDDLVIDIYVPLKDAGGTAKPGKQP